MAKLKVKRVRPQQEKLLYKVLTVLFVMALMCVALLIKVSDTKSFASSTQARIWFFDVGQGDAIFLESLEGEQLLIDGGPNSYVLSKLGDVMVPWDRTIDAVLFTHPDADHISGIIPVLDRYNISTIFETGMRSNTQVMRSLEQAIVKEQADHIFLKTGDRIPFAGMDIRVLYPHAVPESRFSKDTNSSSIVLLVRCESGASVLLTGDATFDSEKEFGIYAGDIDVLKLGHHGSVGSTSTDFLNQVLPEHAIISVGENNSYGHPHPVVLQRLRELKIEVFRTDKDSDILFSCTEDGFTIQSNPLTF